MDGIKAIIGAYILIQVFLALLPGIAANLSQVDFFHYFWQFLQTLLKIIGLG